MADEPENPALAVLQRLEAKLDGLTRDVHHMRGEIARVEKRLARLETEYGVATSDVRVDCEPVVLDIPGLAPPLSTGEDEDAIADLMRQIWARRTCVHVLSDEEREALEQAWRQGVVSRDEVAAFVNRRRGG